VSDGPPVPDDRYYTAEHEWIRLDGNRAVVGITHFAQDQLGDVVYVDLPAVGATVEAGQPFGEVESTKSVSDLFAPVTGEVTARNEDLDDAPERVNEDPYGDGWLVELTVEGEVDTSALMDAAAYRAHAGA
jgi:glycine cleavage system H protein